MTSVVLARGGNTAVVGRAFEVLVSWRAGAPVDVCALLVAADGKVRRDSDFVFFNQREDPSGSVRLMSDSHSSASVGVNLSAVPSDVTRVVIAGSMDASTFDAISDLELTVTGEDRRVLTRFPVLIVEAVDALVFGEFYRRADGWKFRAVGQGWAAGLAGLIAHYGVAINDESSAEPSSSAVPLAPASTAAHSLPPVSPPTATPVLVPIPSMSVPTHRADWYPASDDPSVLRWWTGAEWSTLTAPNLPDTSDTCGRCGASKRRKVFARRASCGRCETETTNIIQAWQARAAQILAQSGPAGPAWEALWVELRYHHVHEDNGREALRPVALQHLHQVVTFAFADELIEEHEVDEFDEAVRGLGITDPAIDKMRDRLQRGLELGLISNGQVPRVHQTTLSLDIDELLHLEIPAVHVRYLASGPRRSNGRLIATNRRLRYIGDSTGSDLTWVKIVEVRAEYDCVIIAATTARGCVSYQVNDPIYAAAVLTGVLKVAKRTATVDRQRDSRSIPPAIKAEVWRRDGGACAECKASEYLEFDHVIPWSRGGATSLANLQLLCRRCNLAKGARI